MKKITKRKIEENILGYKDDETSKEEIFKSVKMSSIWHILLFGIFLIVSLLNINKLEKLTDLTQTAFFSSKLLFSKNSFIIFLIILILFFTSVLAYIYIVKKNKNIKLKRLYKNYNIYDFVSFAATSFVGLYFVILFLITPCTIEGSSMEATYSSNDRVFVWHLNYKIKDNDVIVFDAKDYGGNGYYIKRIVAKENDIVTFELNEKFLYTMYVNHDYENPVESNISTYQIKKITNNNEYYINGEMIVPKNKVIVLGDNRFDSADSRILGMIDKSDIVGVVIFRFYPFNKMGNPTSNIIDHID